MPQCSSVKHRVVISSCPAAYETFHASQTAWSAFVTFAGLAPAIPEDLYYMIKKAVVMRKHLEVNRKDKDGKFRLILVESRIHRLARYYKVC